MFVSQYACLVAFTLLYLLSSLNTECTAFHIPDYASSHFTRRIKRQGCEFRCLNGQCIYRHQHCDGISDCLDNFDEYPDICDAGTPSVSSPTLLDDSCALPSQPDNGNYTLDRSSTIYILTYSCSPGYQIYPSPNNSVSICHRGKWYPNLSECVRTCGPRISDSVDTYCEHKGIKVDCSKPMIEGTTVRMNCQHLYSQMDSSANLVSVCKDGSWDYAFIECVPVTTVTPPCSVLSQTTVNGDYACKGQLIFEDNFLTLNQKKWKTENKISGTDYQFVIYMDFPENVRIRNNHLYLKPTLSTDRFGENFIYQQVNLGRNCTGIPGTRDCDRKALHQILPPIISGRVKTKDTFSFRYGKVYIRAKLPRGSWIYPELFLQPVEFAYGLQYDSGQMRVAFSIGNAGLGNELQGGIILGTREEARRYGMRTSVKDEGEWSDDFHVYSLHWTPNMISVSVDGISYGTIKPPTDGFASQAMDLKTSAGQRWISGEHIAPFDKEFYLSLGVGVGGHNFPDNIPGKPWKNNLVKNTLKFWQDKNTWYSTWSAESAMQVDYVKVWAL